MWHCHFSCCVSQHLGILGPPNTAKQRKTQNDKSTLFCPPTGGWGQKALICCTIRRRALDSPPLHWGGKPLSLHWGAWADRVWQWFWPVYLSFVGNFSIHIKRFQHTTRKTFVGGSYCFLLWGWCRLLQNLDHGRAHSLLLSEWVRCSGCGFQDHVFRGAQQAIQDLGLILWGPCDLPSRAESKDCQHQITILAKIISKYIPRLFLSGHVILDLTGNKFSKCLFRSGNLFFLRTNSWTPPWKLHENRNLGIFFRSCNALHEIK